VCAGSANGGLMGVILLDQADELLRSHDVDVGLEAVHKCLDIGKALSPAVHEDERVGSRAIVWTIRLRLTMPVSRD
jgi:hypothetical protein